MGDGIGSGDGAGDGAAAGKRRIVIFADGTGNAFAHQESNIWRLFQAVDQSRGDQFARYIPGVGTQSIRPLAALDGATGFGVPANVRELYRFICWTWRPGDEIWMFGFSRGAFTIRTLVGLIDHAGLMPREIGGQPVTEAVMTSNCAYAWRSYRRSSARTPFLTYPTVATARALLDVWWSARQGHLDYLAAQAELERPDNDGRRRPPIEMLGLFDTVEAFGMPIEELRPVVNHLIWPVTFRNQRCSELVANIRHALAIDDERTTFHPVRFEHRGLDSPQVIEEVWFPGMHSDVGGGYPDDSLAMVPLSWIAGEAAELGLRFKPGSLESWAAQASPIAPLHDSRAGASILYRYDPRPIENALARGGPPVLHHSVAERVANDACRYGPVNLPDDIVIRPHDRTVPDPAEEGDAAGKGVTGKGATGKGGATSDAPGSNPPGGPANGSGPARLGSAASVETAISRIAKPDHDILEHARDVVWWRRLHYFAMLWGVVLAAAFPWIAPALARWTREGTGVVRLLAGPASLGADELTSLTVQGAEWASALAPAALKPWFAAFGTHWMQFLLLAGFLLLMYLRSAKLQGQIHDISRLAWRRPDGGGPVYAPKPSMAFARRLRTNPPLLRAYRIATGYVLPTLVGGLVLAALAVVVSRMTVHAVTTSGRICVEANRAATTGVMRRDVNAAPDRGSTASPSGGVPFRPDTPCWASGVLLEKGVTYEIEITPTVTFTDRSLVAGLRGFSDSPSPFSVHGWISGYALKRWPDEPWFRVIYQIGPRAAEAGPLKPAGEPAVSPPPPAPEWLWRVGERECGASCTNWQELPQPIRASIERALRSMATRETALVATITPKTDGELFLYVNDAMAGWPILGATTRFYRNNAGEAQVRVRRVTR